jgi:hypothetical protein
MPQNAPMASTLEEAIERLADTNELVFAGDGAEAEAEAIRRASDARGKNGWSINQSERSPAENITRLAFLSYEGGDVQTPATLKACYVRASEAEIKLSMGLLGSKIKRSMKPERA